MHWARPAWARCTQATCSKVRRAPKAERTEMEREMSSSANDARQPLILNVNDNEGARYLVTLMLQKAGFFVIEAATGLAALEKVERRKPDLVVLDLKLPD